MHLLRKRQRPHPELASEHLLNVLQPEHVVLVGMLFKSPVVCAGAFGTDAWVAYLFVFHHFKSRQVVVELDYNANSQRYQSD